MALKDLPVAIAAVFALVMIAQLGAGQYALIFLAGLKGIPVELYESAAIDGAGRRKPYGTR